MARDAATEVQSAAPFAILIEANGTVLFEKNADELMRPSSMSKLMTAEFVFNAIRDGRLKPEDQFTISKNAWRRGGEPSGVSTMYAALGSKVTVLDLLFGAIVVSGNDACIALAEGIAGTEHEFAMSLNERARELGLTRSNFSNATGLPDPHLKVTPRELAKLAQHIIWAYPEFYKIFGEREFTWNNMCQQNRNALLFMAIGADGMKTGFTDDAGYGLVGSAVRNDRRFIVVVNGLSTDRERGEEARQLLEWGMLA
jgi:D-alanyl-D-alanine carboxypeptidase (penicillin-binding protein 5/6)